MPVCRKMQIYLPIMFGLFGWVGPLLIRWCIHGVLLGR